MRNHIIVAAVVTSLLGCGTNPTKQDIGTIIGVVSGGVVASHFGGGSGKTLLTIAGMIAGGWAGSAVGRSMDEQDRRYAEENLRYGLSSSVMRSDTPVATSRWERDHRRYESSVRTYPNYRNSMSNCKEFVQEITVWIDGRKETATTPRGVACRNPRTGEWEILPN